jgi:hypothetical protein
MRYILEAKNKKDEGTVEEFYLKNKTIKLVDSYDPYEKVSKEVEKVGLALRAFQKSGIDWSVFTTYLRGCSHSKSEIESFMGDVNSFMKKIGLLAEKKYNQKTGKWEY